MTIRRSLVLVGALAVVPSLATAGDFVVEPGAGVSELMLGITLPFEGDLIGDYDAKTNPGGTQTRPGLFGGSGNNPIAYAASLALAVPGASTSPTGGISIDTTLVDIGLVGVDAFDLDLLAESTVTLGTEVTLIYETFNTINPFSVYPGGFEIAIPLAGAQIQRSELALLVPSVLVAVPTKEGISLTGTLPVLWALEIDFGIDVGVQAIELPVNLPFSAILAGEGETQTLSVAADFATTVEQSLDLPPFEALPLALPTIPPSGNEANLLMSGAVTAVALEVSLGLDLVATPGFIPELADVNEDGVVNSADLGLVIGAWGQCQACAEDINGDGWVNSVDLGLVIAGWTPMP